MYKLILLCLVPAILGQQIFDGACSDHNVESQQDFDAAAYLGKWNELQRYENTFQKDGDCVTANYALKDDGTIQVINAMRLFNKNNTDNEIEGVATLENPENNEGKLLVQFPGSPKAKYWVVKTDYNQYSVVWSCYDFAGKNLQYLWILARTPQVGADVQKSIDDVLTEHKLDTGNRRTTNNDADKCK